MQISNTLGSQRPCEVFGPKKTGPKDQTWAGNWKTKDKHNPSLGLPNPARHGRRVQGLEIAIHDPRHFGGFPWIPPRMGQLSIKGFLGGFPNETPAFRLTNRRFGRYNLPNVQRHSIILIPRHPNTSWQGSWMSRGLVHRDPYHVLFNPHIIELYWIVQSPALPNQPGF